MYRSHSILRTTRSKPYSCYAQADVGTRRQYLPISPVVQSKDHSELALLGSPHHCTVTGEPAAAVGHWNIVALSMAKLSKSAKMNCWPGPTPATQATGYRGPPTTPCVGTDATGHTSLQRMRKAMHQKSRQPTNPCRWRPTQSWRWCWAA
jgi:hypothetical protein